MNHDKFTREVLVELVARNLPTFTNEAKPKMDGVDQTVIDEYFSHFIPPDKNGNCICCGARQGSSGNIVDSLLNWPRFKWGLAHGEGFCDKCGYPGRAKHYIDAKLIATFILQYHPKELAFPEPDQQELESKPS